MNTETYDFCVNTIDYAIRKTTKSEWKLENVHTNYYIIAFAEEGSADYVIDGKEYQIEKGAMILFDKDQIHSAFSNPDKPWSFYSIAFDIHCFSEFSLNSLEPVIYVDNYEQCKKLFSKLYDAYSKKSDAYILICRSIIMELLYYNIRQQTIKHNPVLHHEALETIKDYIIEHTKEHFTIEFLADMVNLSPSYCRYLFKKYTGQSIIQYSNSIKIEKACSLLKSGLCNVTEAAEAVGFSNVHYFCRLCKKTTGKTPSKYMF